MRVRGFARAGTALLLLSVAGCEYWENLIEDKRAARAELDLVVEDAWTGELLADTYCMDRDRDSLLAPYDQGKYRFRSVATGPYSIRCEHEWYFESIIDVDLTAGGAGDTVRMVRRGLSDWYPDPEKKVAIPGPDSAVLRFPMALDWYATPSDDNGRFRYEWTFLRTPQLSQGHVPSNGPVPKDALSPRFQKNVPASGWIKEGADTAILNVYSLLNGARNAYLVGSDTMAIRWARNAKPEIAFLGNVATYNVGCREQSDPLWISIRASDSDGHCDSVRVWAANAPSLPGMDTRFACTQDTGFPVKLKRPVQPGRIQNDQEEYDNILIAEATDDNGEKSRDTLKFITYVRTPPRVDLKIPKRQSHYFAAENVPFELTATTTFGWFEWLELAWTRKATGELVQKYTHYPIDNPKNTASLTYRRPFDRDSYIVRGYALDNCGNSTEIDSLEFTVVANSLPSITELKPVGLPSVSDSGLVRFSLAAMDPDADGVLDNITRIEINWRDGSDREIRDTLAASISIQLVHKYRLGPGGIPEVSVTIWDMHDGWTEKSISLGVPLP